MPDPVASCVLTGSPCAGRLQLPHPRPAFDIRIDPGTQNARQFVAMLNGTLKASVPMLYVPASPDSAAFLHTTVLLDEYEFRIAVTWQGDATTLEVFDDLVQRVPYALRTAPLAVLDERGQVVADEPRQKRKTSKS